MKIKIYLLILFCCQFIFGQKIVFSKLELKENPNNIFSSLENLGARGYVKVSNLNGYLVIDYTRKYYLYSFIFDSNINLIEERNRKLKNTGYPDFFESYGTIENRVSVFKGFKKDKLFMVKTTSNHEGQLVDIGKNIHIGSFVHKEFFYYLGYQSKKQTLILHKFDSNLKKTSKEFTITSFFDSIREKELDNFHHIFNKSKFYEVSNKELNSLKEVSKKNKFYIQNDKLLLSINTSSKQREDYPFYVLEINLKSFEKSYKKFKNPINEISWNPKFQQNSYLFDNKIFTITGSTKGFLLNIFEYDSKKILYKQNFDVTSITNNVFFDFETSGLLKNKKNIEKDIANKLKQVFNASVGIKVNQYGDNYNITIGRYEAKYNSTGIGSNATSIPFSFEKKISLNLALNKKSYNLLDRNLTQGFNSISDFRKDTFFEDFNFLGIKSSAQKKELPKAEIQFKYNNSYFWAYFYEKQGGYIIREFN